MPHLAETLTMTTHRPWPLPRHPWIMRMQWQDLLFLHWPLPATLLQPLIPRGLTLETFAGQAWIGVVPFRMTDVSPRGVPALPWLSRFAELNVRTYVTVEDKPGVWFFSLDAANPLAVHLARLTFSLPYYTARMTVTAQSAQIHYSSQRTHRRAHPAQFQGVYGPTGAMYQARPGSLEFWLTERYCLYAADRHAHLWRGDIHHQPWPLQPAAADVQLNTMTAPLGIKLPDIAPLAHFVKFLQVVAWAVQAVGSSPRL